MARDADEDGPTSEEETGPDSDDAIFEDIDGKDLGNEVPGASSDEEIGNSQASRGRALLPTKLAGTYDASTTSWSQPRSANETSLPSSSSQ